MNIKKLEFKGIKFLFFVIIIHILIFLFDGENSIFALTKSFEVLLKLLPIFVMIIFIMTLINYLLKPKSIMKHFGKDSGIKAWIYAILGGIVSHGPMYAWYPMISELRQNGLRDGLLATFMYTRSIKIPFIPIMIDYFGVVFTIILFIYILLGGILQGIFIEALSKKID
ncbi:MAG: permease [Arcobacter sp.]|nr:MAG: permease [Arcobacter sp.]